MILEVWKSGLARRFIKIFLFLVTAPLTVALLFLVITGARQVGTLTNDIQNIVSMAMTSVCSQFKRVGAKSVNKSTHESSHISVAVLKSTFQDIDHSQQRIIEHSMNGMRNLSEQAINETCSQTLRENRKELTTVTHVMNEMFTKTNSSIEKSSLSRIDRYLLEEHAKLLHQYALDLANDINDRILRTRTVMELIGSIQNNSGRFSNDQLNVIKALLSQQDDIHGLLLVDPHGRVLESVRYNGNGFFIADDIGKTSGNHSILKFSGYLPEKNSGGMNRPLEIQVVAPGPYFDGKLGALKCMMSLGSLESNFQKTTGQKNARFFISKAGYPDIHANRISFTGYITSSAPIPSVDENIVVMESAREILQPISSFTKRINTSLNQAQYDLNRRISAAVNNTNVEIKHDTSRLNRKISAKYEMSSHRLEQNLHHDTELRAVNKLAMMRSAILKHTNQLMMENQAQMNHANEIATLNLDSNFKPLISMTTIMTGYGMVRMSLLLILIAIVIGVIWAMYLSMRIVTPIIRLSNATNEICQKRMDAKVEENGADEIGQLAHSFNIMVDSLCQSQSELKDAEAQLIQSAKMASLGTLSAGVAHELNQPLAVIRGVAQQMKHADGLSKDLIEDIELIEGQTTRMMKIIKHLRTFSRIGGAEYGNVDLNQVVQNCFIFVGEQLKSHSITVETDLDPALPSIIGDANEMEQVLLNLITNSRDSLDAINTMDEKRIRIKTFRDEHGVSLMFQDNGAGIPDNILNKIFDPFFTTKDPGKGTGLGLSISHGIITKMKGSIQAKNDNGALFIICLNPVTALQEKQRLVDAA